MSNCIVFWGYSVLSDKSAICKCGFVALQLHLHSLTSALTPSKLLASASQSHDLLKKPVTTLPFTASLIFSSQSLECQDSKKVESSNTDSKFCHTEPLGEVSKILQSKRDFSPFSKTHTSETLAHTYKYDKNLDSYPNGRVQGIGVQKAEKLKSTANIDSIYNTSQITQNLDSINFAPLHPAPTQLAGNLKSKNTQSTQNLKMLHNLCSQRFTKADFKDYATLHKHLTTLRKYLGVILSVFKAKAKGVT
ncbi:hypothetical protein HCN_1142 [Helicobacter cinaedi PAGU611]|uniref:hypothetical protein n=1 Tax=Helicobacter cinaedi TaxID=213 RepID=UPI00025D3475|nr:hypothetical protein [Helicobacter cinaedi]BAM12362.1 hypothetical protein HCN_1142 [Helicobacter cinaedi PAGU611]